MDINRYTPKLKLSTDKLLSLDNLTPEDIFEILHLARQIKQRDRMKERVYPLKDKVVAIILDSSNSRLRIPFELTVTQLGGHTRISPLSYSLAHITEKPHCGITPAAAPTAGANFPESARFSRPFVSSRSRSSIKT